MNCCTCNGSCCHVGPHSYCAVHGGGIWQQPSHNLGWWVNCEHCYCHKVETDSRLPVAQGPHRQCCKCLVTMAEEFINECRSQA